MSDVNQFRAMRVPASLFGNNTSYNDGNAYSAPHPVINNLRQINGGAFTANTYKTLLSVSGAGVLKFAGLNFGVDAQAAKMKITVDGVLLAEFTQQTAINLSGKCVPIIGSMANLSADALRQTSGVWMDWIPFNTSLLIEAQSSVSTGGAVGLLVNYMTYQ